MTKQFKAFGVGNSSGVACNTPKEAAISFFERNPSKRKCNIYEGMDDGHFFSVSFGRKSTGEWPWTKKDVTKKDVPAL